MLATLRKAHSQNVVHKLKKTCKMKKEIFKSSFLLLLLLIIFSCSDMKSQILISQDSLIRIQKIKIFPVSNPAPQYIVEIRNDMTISYYNILPENFSKDHPGFKGWLVDSTTIRIENSDFADLEKTINGVDLNNTNTHKKGNSENNIVAAHSGYFPDNYIIEISNQKIEFSIGVYDKDVSISYKTIRNIFEKLEDKYKPKK